MAGPFQNAGAWTNDFLEPMRQVGDPPADAAIEAIFATGSVGAVNALMKGLVTNEGYVPASLPPVVQVFLAHTEDLPPWADPRRVAIAEDVFGHWGPQIVLVLLCYSLPFCYAAHKGVQVLAMTSRLTGNATRRIVETAQMVVDVLRPGGLTSADGRGRRTLQKVRLMHAAVRRLAVASSEWNPAWGLPINQEDLAGTLMSFSWITLDGLRKLRIRLSPEQEEAYLHFWAIVGEQLGIREDLIPADIPSADALSDSISRRQFGASPEGVAMTDALVKMMQYQIPGNLLDGMPAILISYLLGSEGAGYIGVHQDLAAQAVGVPLSVFGHAVSDLNRDAVIADAATKMSRLLINSAVLIERQGNRPAFAIPDQLKQQWGVNWLS